MSAALDVCTRVTILALEPEPQRAPVLREMVGTSLDADITFVSSQRQLFETLRAAVPDVILLPPLLEPADEADLVAYLRSRPDASHVELLVMPFVVAADDHLAEGTVERRGWWRRNPSQRDSGMSASQAFADQLTCAIQCARHARDAGGRRIRSADEGGTGDGGRIIISSYAPGDWERARLSPSAGAAFARKPQSDSAWVSYTDLAREDRRAYRRIPATELAGLRAARLQDGPPVTLIDFSAGGVLLASAITLRPASVVTLELSGESTDAVVPIRVVRCQTSTTPSLYLGACAFREPLDLSALLRIESTGRKAAEGTVAAFDRRVQAIVERYALDTRLLLRALRDLRDAARIDNDAFRDLLTYTIEALTEREDPGEALSMIEQRLDEALPGVTARFGSIPALSLGPANETVYFAVPRRAASDSRVLNVELQQGATVKHWHLRLLKASAYLAALLPDARRQYPTRKIS